ncbi:MAG: hypothetical protein WBE22_05725 [Halobacteriota archaeon]
MRPEDLMQSDREEGWIEVEVGDGRDNQLPKMWIEDSAKGF